MRKLQTPDQQFQNLPDFPWEPHFIDVPDGEGGTMRVSFLDENVGALETVLMMHGEPSWSFLYRKMIPTFITAGYRVVVPDLPGFGRSDKPASRQDYTYKRFVDWMQAWLEKVGLHQITLVCQDWGGLIGLRLACALPERFARIVAANTGLPTGDGPVSEAFLNWRKFSLEVENFDVASIITMGCDKPITEKVAAAYNAPFPDDTYKEGARIFPSLVPIDPNDPAAPANRDAWKILENWKKPFLTAFSDKDPITRGGEQIFHARVPGTRNQPHATIKGGGHFLQEDCGEEFARIIAEFIQSNPV